MHNGRVGYKRKQPHQGPSIISVIATNYSSFERKEGWKKKNALVQLGYVLELSEYSETFFFILGRGEENQLQARTRDRRWTITVPGGSQSDRLDDKE